MKRITAALVTLAITAVATGTIPNCTYFAAAEETDFLPRIGVILPMTGEFAPYGDKIRKAIEGKLKGSATLIFEDEGCDPLLAVKAYQKLSNADGINVFF